MENLSREQRIMIAVILGAFLLTAILKSTRQERTILLVPAHELRGIELRGHADE